VDEPTHSLLLITTPTAEYKTQYAMLMVGISGKDAEAAERALWSSTEELAAKIALLKDEYEPRAPRQRQQPPARRQQRRPTHTVEDEVEPHYVESEPLAEQHDDYMAHEQPLKEPVADEQLLEQQAIEAEEVVAQPSARELAALAAQRLAYTTAAAAAAAPPPVRQPQAPPLLRHTAPTARPVIATAPVVATPVPLGYRTVGADFGDEVAPRSIDERARCRETLYRQRF